MEKERAATVVFKVTAGDDGVGWPGFMVGPSYEASVRRPKYEHREHRVQDGIDSWGSVLRCIGLGSGQRKPVVVWGIKEGYLPKSFRERMESAGIGRR